MSVRMSASVTARYSASPMPAFSQGMLTVNPLPRPKPTSALWPVLGKNLMPYLGGDDDNGDLDEHDGDQCERVSE